MKITLAYLTVRPGGLDLFGNALVDQEDKDYELIVVDDFAGRAERGKAKQFFLNSKLPLAWYGPSKPTSCPSPRLGLTNAMNTAALAASRGTDVIVYVHDYTWLPSDAVSLWKSTFASTGLKVLIQGIGIVFGAERPECPSDVSTWGRGLNLIRKWTWAPSRFELFYLGVPVRFVEELNGFDERSDACGQFILDSIATQAASLGYSLAVSHSLIANLVDHREWSDSYMGINSPWRILGHVSSERSCPRWCVPSPNPYDFKKLRELRCSSA